MPSLDKKLISKLTKRLLETEKKMQSQNEEINFLKKQLKSKKPQNNLENPEEIKEFFLSKKITKKSEIILNSKEIQKLKTLLKIKNKENLSPIKYKKKKHKKHKSGRNLQKNRKNEQKVKKRGQKDKKDKQHSLFFKTSKTSNNILQKRFKNRKIPF